MLFGLLLLIVIYYAIPVITSIWCIYGLVMWRGIWRMLALLPLIFTFTGFYYFVWINNFHISGEGYLDRILFDANLLMLPYVFFVILFRRDAQKKRAVADGVR